MSRRDGKARMPWSVKGVSPEARDLAKTVTSREGETMGDWLSDVIRRVGAAQAAGRPLGPPHRRGLPALPGRRPTGETARAVPLPPQPAATPVPEADTVDEAALAELVAERIERTEARLVGLLGSIEDIVVRLTDRLERLEGALDDPDEPDGPSDPHPTRRSLPRS